ncbi:MAG: glycoside hydrolase family 3 C-terminal domain-containing protein, partial [Planctomycetota bacterium]
AFAESAFQTPAGEPGVILELFDNNSCTGSPAVVHRAERIDASWMEGASPDPAIGTELFSARWRARIVAPDDGEYVITSRCSDGGYRVWLDDELVVDTWHSENAGPIHHHHYLQAGQPLAVRVEYRKARHWAGMWLGWEAAIGWDVGSTAAVAAAAAADAVVFTAGFTAVTESEGFDRHWSLHPAQTALLDRVLAANPRTVVLLYAGGAVDVEPWADRVAALMHCWYPGMNGTRAAVEILCGRTVPAGRLPISWCHRLTDYPAAAYYHDHAGTRRVDLGEGLFVGHRGLRTPPRYPFGYGLGYTTCTMEDLQLSGAITGADDVIDVRCRIHNTGTRAGIETVLLFAGPCSPQQPRPARVLTGAARVAVEAGASGHAHFVLSGRDLRQFDGDRRCWSIPAGDYRLTCARHAEDAGLQALITIPTEIILEELS